MSAWSSTGSGATGNAQPSYGPPPLPPRNTSQGPTPGQNAVPPPLPPRPVGFGHQPIRDSGAGIQRKPIPAIPNNGVQATASVSQGGRVRAPVVWRGSEYNETHSYPSIQSDVPPSQAPGYSDISHLFPDGKIPPPPPLLHPLLPPLLPPLMLPFKVNDSPEPSPSASKYDTSGPPAAIPPQDSANAELAGVHIQENKTDGQSQVSFSTEPTPASEDSRQMVDADKDSATHTTTNDTENKSAAEANTTQRVDYSTANHDVAKIYEAFQSMQLTNPSTVAPQNAERRNNTGYRAYSPQQASSTGPAVPGKHPLPTQQPPDVRSPSTNVSTPPPTRPRAVLKECMATFVVFPSMWYEHPQVPGFPICANCYENHIRDSRFAGEFQGTFQDDGQGRACKFSTPRMRESLWEGALASGSLDGVLAYMALRRAVPNCAGQAGAKGSAGVRWYVVRNQLIPGMVVCQACYEDLLLAAPGVAEARFEPCAGPHADDQTWSCDMAVPYIYREYKTRAATDDWRPFPAAVRTRLSLKPCPGGKQVYPFHKWFTPVNGPRGVLICAACYCDYVLLTGQEGLWRDAGDNLALEFGVSISCFFGAQANLRILALQTIEKGDYALFWRGFETACREPLCERSAKGATWFTLLSDPAGFEICRTCHVAFAESMGVAHHFKPKPGAPPEQGVTCSFNPAIARFPTYMEKFMDLVYTQDPGRLEAFIAVYASMPLCARDAHVENGRWFGWDECTICAECHHEFVRGTALADAMPHRGTPVQGGVMCEMYSRRMRDLYLAACASDPPDPAPLLEYSLRRRAVWAETMPRVRQIMSDINVKIMQQSMMNNNSMFYTWSGNLWKNTLPLEQTYGGSAIGSGHYNHMQVKGAEYGRQAVALGNEIRASPAHVADELERQWRAVE